MYFNGIVVNNLYVIFYNGLRLVTYYINFYSNDIYSQVTLDAFNVYCIYIGIVIYVV